MAAIVALLSALFTLATSALSLLLRGLLEEVVLQPLAGVLPKALMERLLRLLGPRVEEGTKPELLYRLPVYQRADGATIKLGYLVKMTRGGTDSYVVKRILARVESESVTLGLGLVTDEGVLEEEVECSVEGVSCVRGRQAVLGLARDGMADIAATIVTYPMHMQRQVRRHQVAAALRREVQRFLGGFQQAATLSLGTVDWRLDPAILGLERLTDFSLDYRIEQFVDKSSHLDRLLGSGWDYRSVHGSDGYRIVLTLELFVDLNQELRVTLHATQCALDEGTGSPRRACLATHRPGATPAVTVQDAEAREDTEGATLAWDEYQPVSREASPRHRVPSATCSMDDFLLTASLPTNTSTALHGLDKLLSAIPSSQLVFNASPIQEVEERQRESSRSLGMSVGSLAAGPNTSTPADELEVDNSNRSTAGVSRDSSPHLENLQDATAEDRLGLNSTETDQAKKRLSGQFNMTDLLGPAEELARGREAEVEIKEEEVKNDAEVKVVELKQEGKVIDKEVVKDKTEVKACDEEDYVTEVDKGVVNHEKNVIPLKEKSDAICQEVETTKVEEGESESSINNTDNVKVNNNDEETRDEGEECIISVKPHDAKLVGLSEGGPPCLPSPTTTPLAKVASYLQAHRPTDATPAAAGDEGALDLSTTDADDMNVSVTSSHSVASRQSELSSLAGLRMRGVFGGAMAAAGAPVCPFPDDWQYNAIPEVIENDEDID